jgi:hypothetical protein
MDLLPYRKKENATLKLVACSAWSKMGLVHNGKDTGRRGQREIFGPQGRAQPFPSILPISKK